MPPTSQFFQVSASGELGEIGACEGTQAVLAILHWKEKSLSSHCGKIRNFFGQYPNRGDITLFTINIRNSGKGGEKNGRPRILAAQGNGEYVTGGKKTDCGGACG